MTYLQTVALGADDLASAIILNRNDLCISAACGLYRRGPAAIAPLELAAWQLNFLRYTGNALEYFWPGHCEGAIQGDIQRGKSALALLSSQEPTP